MGKFFSIACAFAFVACDSSQPMPPTTDSSSGAVVIQKGDTAAAIANARAALAELDMQQQDQAAIGAALLEGIYNEDPAQIGIALTRLAKSLPKNFPKQAKPAVSR